MQKASNRDGHVATRTTIKRDAYREPMKISVAMATYEGAAYLEEQLKSLALQEKLPDELIVTDDCSSDASVEIVHRFAKAAPFPVRLQINERRLGYCQNFCRALSLSTGDLIFLCDQDDVWLPKKISKIYSVFENDRRVNVVMNDAEFVTADLRPIGITKRSQIRSAGLTDDYFIMGCCAAIRREFLDLLLPIPESQQAHDSWLLQFAIRLNCREIVPDVLQYYRRHGSNESKIFLNSTRKVSRWTAYKTRVSEALGEANSVDRLEKELQELNCRLKQILKKEEEFGYLCGINAVRKYAEELNACKKTLESRLVIRSLPNRIKRISLASKLWYEGGYSCASGMHSVFRDIFL